MKNITDNHNRVQVAPDLGRTTKPHKGEGEGERMKVYVAYGVNRLINAAGPCGVYLTLEEAEAAVKEWCDDGKVQEYEIEPQAHHA